MALILHDVELDGPEPGLLPATPAEYAEFFEANDLAGLRRWVAAVLQAPWGPRVTHAREGVERSVPEEVAVVDGIVEVARALVESRERQAVADQVRRLVRSTGLPQKEFASLVGTSPSRLSTYMSGKVTPSAAMVVRITRVARSCSEGERVSA